MTSSEGEIRRDYICIGFSNAERRNPVVTDCGVEAAQWNFDTETGLLRCLHTGRCIAIAPEDPKNASNAAPEEAKLQMVNCDERDSAQKFKFRKFSASGLSYPDLASEDKK